jgi:hypothetical protein
MHRRIRATSRGLLAAAAGLLAAIPADLWAQSGAAPAPSHGGRLPSNWLGYLLMGVLLVVVIGVSLLPSKRSHQD